MNFYKNKMNSYDDKSQLILIRAEFMAAVCRVAFENKYPHDILVKMLAKILTIKEFLLVHEIKKGERLN